MWKVSVLCLSHDVLMLTAEGGCGGWAPLCPVPFRETSSVGLILFHKETPGLGSLLTVRIQTKQMRLL